VKKVLILAFVLLVAVAGFGQSAAPSKAIQGLPPGMTLSPDGVLQGTSDPSSFGVYLFTAEVCDSSRPSHCALFGPMVVVVTPLFLRSDLVLPSGVIVVPSAIAGAPYVLPLSSRGGIAPYRWKVK
jgi:hypothetical protein